MLDAARALVLGEGVGKVTVRAIADRSRAPMGTLYHRFGSRDALLTAMWIRAVRRSQEGFLAAIAAAPDPVSAAVAASLSVFDFAVAEREDAQLLVSFRREDLIGAAPPEQKRELEELNRPVGAAVVRLTQAIYGARSREHLETVMLAVFDIPHGAVRRHLEQGKVPPASLRPAIAAAARAALGTVG